MFDFIGNTVEAFLWLCCAVPIIGFLAGGTARYIMRSENYSFINDMVIGIAGSVIGNLILGLFLEDPNDIGGGRIISSLIVSIFGAMVLIFIGRRVFGNSPKRRKRR